MVVVRCWAASFSTVATAALSAVMTFSAALAARSVASFCWAFRSSVCAALDEVVAPMPSIVVPASSSEAGCLSGFGG